MKARIRAEEEEAMSNLTPSEYDTLLKLLEKLKSNMLSENDKEENLF